MKKILFLCTHNSARSQIAEGLVNSLFHDRYRAYSAGTEKSRVNSYAVEVLDEIGIDISHHRSKSVEEFRECTFDFVITVCDQAREACPFFPGKRIIHRGFQDPSAIRDDPLTILTAFRNTRDEIRAWLEQTFAPDHNP